MDGYIRVSRRLGRKGPGYISPKIQREAIERWAEYRGVRVLEWHVDEDESGGTHDRPGLDIARDRAVSGQTGGIVSWRIDRFSRYTEGGLRDLRLLDEAGARLAFVAEDIDTSGPMGRLVYTMLLAFAEFFLDNIKAGWVTAKSRAIDRGVHIGPCPVGYQQRADGRLEIDPHYGPLVAEAFRIAQLGLHPAIDYLRAKVPQRTWTPHTTRRFLSQRVYLGRVAYGNLTQDRAHDALVTRAEFEAANHGIGPPRGPRLPPGSYPLSGIATCQTCGHHLLGARGGRDRRRMYRCSNHRLCQAPVAVTAAALEDHVVSVLRKRGSNHHGYRELDASPVAAEALAEVETAERELEAFASDLTARRVLKDRYHVHLQQRADALADAQSKLKEALSTTPPAPLAIPAEMWDSLTLAELGEVLRGMLDTVVVSRGRKPIAERVPRIVLIGDNKRSPVPSPEDP